MVLILSLLFTAGVAVDWLVTRYTQAVVERQAWRAANISATLTLLNVAVLASLFCWVDACVGAIVFALGNWAGVFVALRWPVK